MNKSVLMIMGGALIVAVVVALVVQSRLSPRTTGEAPAMVDILVATKPVAVGQNLSPETLRWQAWPEKSAFRGVIRKGEQADISKLDIYDAPLRRPLETGEPVTRQAMVPKSEGGNNFLAALISPGKRAVAIAVKADTMAGGFIAPGDHVDVILTYAARVTTGREIAEQMAQRFASQTVVSNVRVLAVDQDAKDDARAAKVAKTVTLEVTQEQAQIIALSKRMGQMTLALRRIGDKDVPGQAAPLTSDVTTSDVMKKVNEILGRSKGNMVRMYSGQNIVNVPVRAAPQDAQGEE